MLHRIWFGYFYPSLLGNGPEALVQTVLYAAIAVLVWPPAREALRAFADRKLAPLHAKADKAAVEAEKLAAHSKWMATHLARQMASQGLTVDPHPEHGDLTASDAPAGSTMKP